MMTAKHWAQLGAHAYSILAIFFCLFLGKLLYKQIGGLPASIYGMLIFAALLRVGLLSPERIGGCVNLYLKYMVISFIPAVLGVMEFGELWLVDGWKIVSIAVFTTLIGIASAGLLSQWVLSKSAPKDKGV